jgi:hypothetical protein
VVTPADDLSPLRLRLSEAALAKKILTVIYHGGSQPGAKRKVLPVRATARGLLADDLATGERKAFLLAKLEVVPDDDSASPYVPGLTMDASPAPPKWSRAIEQLTDLASQRLMAEVMHLGRLVRIEPYGVRKSRWGPRLLCFVYDPAPDKVIEADYLQGWHLYALDDISEVRPTGEHFAPRPYRRYEGEDVSITLRVRLDSEIEGGTDR